MKYVRRSEWGAAPPKKKLAALVRRELRGIAVHYEGADNEGIRHDKCDDKVRAIQKSHQNGQGWSDIAYSWLVCRHGTIFEGRGWGMRTAANGTDEGNDGYHAVCYLDDDRNGTDLTADAAASIGAVVRECQALGYGDEVRPHSSFKPTACPGDELRYWIARKGWIPQAAKKAPSSPAKAPSPPPGGSDLPAWYKRPLRIVDGKPFIRGNDVINVQRRLRARESGDYDHDTAVKVRGFQQLNGLTPDGVVGPNTARKLG